MTSITPDDYQSLLLELQRTKAELELKSDELRRARAAKDNARVAQQSIDFSTSESEARYRAIFQQAAVGVAQLDLKGRWLDVNEKLCEIVGYSREELLAKSSQDITHPDDLNAELDYMRQLLTGQVQTYSMEKRFVRKDGKLIWGKMTVSLVRDSANEPIYFISAVEDISGRRRAESVAECQSKVLELIAKGVPAPVSMAALIDRIERAYPGMMCTILRLDDDNIHVRHLAAVNMPEHYLQAIDGLAIGPTTGSCGTAIFRREQVIVEDIATDPLWADYRDLAIPFGLRACWSSPIFDEEGQVLGTFANYDTRPGKPDAEHLQCIAMATHLAAIALSNQRKEMSLHMSDLALKVVSQGVMVTGEDERIIWANPAFESISGYQRSEYVGRKSTFLQGPLTNPATVDAIRKAIKNGAVFSGEILNYRKDKTPYWNELTITPVRNAENEITNFIGVVRDISLRKKTETALIESENHYRQLFESNPNPMWVYDLETLAFLAVNAAAVRQYGYSEQEFLTMTILDIRPQEERGRLLKSLEIPKPDVDHPAAWVHRRKNGEVIHVEITAHRLEFSGRHAELVLAYDITARRKAEVALSESEKRFRAIVERAPLGIAEGEFSGNHFLNVNQRYAEIVGYSVDELKNMTFKELTHPDDLEKDVAEMEKLAAGEIPFFAIEKRYIRKGGEVVWVKLTVAGIGDGGERPTNCLAIIDDISEQKGTVTALEISERRYKTIVEAEPECVKVVGPNGELLEMNQAGLVMLEASSIEEVREYGIAQFILPNYREAFAKVHERAMAGNSSLLEFEVCGLRGTPRWLETHAVPFPDVDGRITKMLSITRDITQRKLTLQALEEKEERLSFVLNHTPAVIYTCKATDDFRMTYITENVQSQFGFHLHELLENGKFWRTVVHPEDQERVLGVLQLLSKEKGEHSHNYRVRHANGTYRWMHDHVMSLRNTEGKATELIGTLMDITSLKKAEEDYRRLNDELETRVQRRTAQLAAANNELEAFSYSVSHDLRAPLRGIDGFARILYEEYGSQLDAEGVRLIGVVRSEAKRMGQLVDDLLTFSRMGRKQIEKSPIDMRALAQDAYDTVTNDLPKGSIRFELGTLPSANGDRSLLRQVFFNLIDNAVKFSRGQPAPVVEVGWIDENDLNAYFVRDNGVGFDEQYKKKLFGVFQRLHSEAEFEGSGIGLALVQRIIHRHGGKVWATSKPHDCTTFYFTIPNVVKIND